MDKVLKKLLTNINKQYGPGTILPASKATSLIIERMSSGILDLDMKIGGGFPRGRISMLKGDFSTGKSAICLKTAATAQRSCRYCGEQFELVDFFGEVIERDCRCGKREPMIVVWLDAEHSLDPAWTARWGVDTERLYVIETEYAEQAIDVADACIRSAQCDLLVVDSIAAMAPGVEVEESSEKWQMGVMARLMNKALRKWTSGLNSGGLLAETMCTILLVNQLRVGIGGFRPTITSPGGRGLDFFQSLELRFKRVKFIEDQASKRPIGIEVDFTIKKNKTAPPGIPGGKFALYFVPDPGRYSIGSTDTDAQVMRLAKFWGLVVRGGSWFTFPDGTKVQGEERAVEKLREDPHYMQVLETEIRARELAWMETGLGPEVEDDEEEEDE